MVITYTEWLFKTGKHENKNTFSEYLEYTEQYENKRLRQRGRRKDEKL
jgi:hypothetical protein